MAPDGFCSNGTTGVHPNDGSAWESPGDYEMVRGDPMGGIAAWDLTNRQRDAYDGGYTRTGFRCAR